jgi:peroxiredoxin
MRTPIPYPEMTPARWLQAAVAGLALLAVLLAVVTRVSGGSNTATERLVGSPASAFSLQAEYRGQLLPGTVSLAEQRGHNVLLVFMYSLCAHCLSQIDTVHELDAQDVSPGLRVLYIDSPAESPSIISAYAERLGIESPTTPILLDNGALAQAYGVRYYPTTFLVDARGIVRKVWTGETSGESLRSAIKLLGETAARSSEAEALTTYEYP